MKFREQIQTVLKSIADNFVSELPYNLLEQPTITFDNPFKVEIKFRCEDFMHDTHEFLTDEFTGMMDIIYDDLPPEFKHEDLSMSCAVGDKGYGYITISFNPNGVNTAVELTPSLIMRLNFKEEAWEFYNRETQKGFRMQYPWKFTGGGDLQSALDAMVAYVQTDYKPLADCIDKFDDYYFVEIEHTDVQDLVKKISQMESTAERIHTISHYLKFYVTSDELVDMLRDHNVNC